MRTVALNGAGDARWREIKYAWNKNCHYYFLSSARVSCAEFETNIRPIFMKRTKQFFLRCAAATAAATAVATAVARFCSTSLQLRELVFSAFAKQKENRINGQTNGERLDGVESRTFVLDAQNYEFTIHCLNTVCICNNITHCIAYIANELHDDSGECCPVE